MRKKVSPKVSAKRLCQTVCNENRRLFNEGLVILTEGNVSGISPDRTQVVIKPSGIPYARLKPESMVVVDLDGRVERGKLSPSSDTAIHLEIYRNFQEIGGIAHTHSPFATIFAQMKRPIPCYGTTHADAFFEDVPVTRSLIEDEIFVDFELNTGRVICERLDPKTHRAILVAGHGPFAFGETAEEAVDNALILEKVAMMALLGTYDAPLQDAILKYRHFHRKHGKGEHKYYGQEK